MSHSHSVPFGLAGVLKHTQPINPKVTPLHQGKASWGGGKGDKVYTS